MSDTRATSETPVATRGRAVNTTLWVVQVLLAVFFVFVGFVKLAGFQAQVDAFTEIGLGQWFRYLTGALEVAGGVGLLIPRLSGTAALGLAGVMVGAVITHLTVLPPAGYAVAPAFLVVVFGLIAWGRRPQTKALVGKPTH